MNIRIERLLCSGFLFGRALAQDPQRTQNRNDAAGSFRGAAGDALGVPRAPKTYAWGKQGGDPASQDGRPAAQAL